ncbi:bacteriohemerythrin [Paramagnetospirillum magnetotacticum]|uniref:bacteriohemerythrin n=1 Tax=Paramagnetospirillum magnetotacticum TaxID=188 RepID=UPI000597B0E5|nr:hemerythrin domain-containing protein [Paramagnetospirillum magnetotacticum]
MTGSIIWRDDMSVGNSDLDHQHRRLIDTANMVRGLSGDEDAEIIQAALEEVVEYILHHLDFEEELLEKCAFENIDSHKALHNEIRDGVLTISQNNKIATSAILVGMMDQIINHIFCVDQEYNGKI